MTMLLPIVIAVVAVPLWDWAAIGRMGLLALDCDYQYWPLSKSRIASVLLLVIAACFVGLVATGELHIPPMEAFLVAAPALVVWAIVGFLDVMAQNRRGYRDPLPPARYSDPRF